MTSWPAGAVMADHLAGLGDADGRALVAGLVAEITALLGTDLGLGNARADDWEAVREGLAADLESKLNEPGLALVTDLACDRRTPVSAFVEDLAEILFIPRPDRSEYRFHSQHAPPWRIERLLLEYATWSRRLDAHQDALTKALCAQACDRRPVGCCSVLGYDLGLVPDRLLKLQRLEARRVGWTQPAREDKCRYHSPTGCVLRLFKSPACIGFLCAGLESELVDRFGPPARELIERLARFQTCDLDRSAVFEQMRLAFEAGQALLTDSGQVEEKWA